MHKKEENCEKWTEIISRQKLSGLTQTKWCAENDINIHNFRRWLSRLKKTIQPDEELSIHKWTTLIPVLPKDSSNVPIKVSLGNISIEVNRGFDAELLKNVVATLSSYANE